jgi:phage terminase large subunit-like protein
VSVNDGSRSKGWYWKPEGLIADHTKRDRARYDLWAKQGHLIAAPGRVINPRLIAQKIIDLCGMYDVRGLAFDRYRMSEVLRTFDDLGFIASEDGAGHIRLVPWGQGYKDMGPAVNAFEIAVLTGDLKHDNNPLTNMCVANAMVDQDASGNRKMDKDKSRMRIDGAVALAMALGLKALDRVQPPPTNPWDDPNFKLFG